MLLLKPFGEPPGRSMVRQRILAPRRTRKDCFPPRSAGPTFTFIARRDDFRDRKGLNHPSARIYVRLLGPCFKTGRLKPFCHKKTSSRHRCGLPSRRDRRNRQAQVTCPRRFPAPGAGLPRRGMPLEENLVPFSVSSVWLLASADFRSVTRRGRGGSPPPAAPPSHRPSTRTIESSQPNPR